MTEKKRYFDELNVYRGLIIVWVVIGHSFDAEQSFLGFLHNYAYSFHMSAFFLLSGFLFSSKLAKSKDIKSKLSVIGNRFERLIIPYFVYTAISYVLKFFLEQYAKNSLSKNILVDTLLCKNNPNGGIWFLYALFFVSAFSILLCNLPVWALFAISVAMKTVTFFYSISIPAISFIFSYSVFFIAGALIAKGYSPAIDKLNNALLKKSSFILFSSITVILLIISFAFTYYCIYYTQNDVISLIIRIFNMLVWYLVAVACTNMPPLKKANMMFGNYGMDIYMLGYYVQIAIRVVFKSMLGTPYLVYSIMMCVFGLFLPIPVSKFIVRKFKITRAVLLGDFSKKDK